MADVRHVDLPKFRGRGVPMVIDIGGVRQCVSELLGRLYKPVRYLLRFCRNFEVKFWFPQFGGTGAPMGVGLRGKFVVSDGASVTSY